MNGGTVKPAVISNDHSSRSTDGASSSPVISVPYYVVGDPSNLSAPGADKLVGTAVFSLKFMKPEDLPKNLSPIDPATNI